MTVRMDAPHETTILASKFDHGEVGRQRGTEIAQCLQRQRLRIREQTLRSGSRRALRLTGLIGRHIRRAVHGCARRSSPAHVDIVAGCSAVGCGREEKRICVPGRERCARRGNWRIKALASERGVECVCEGQPWHGAVIGPGLWALNAAPT